MTPIDFDEYTALRATIRERGTTRVWIALVGMVGWAAAALATVALAVPPIVTLIPLLVLATTFEITFALHIGVERIGRYIQVFFEDQAGGAAWEHRIMAFGRSDARRIATDPLFVRSFLFGTLLNLLTAVLSAPVVIEWAFLGIAHALLAVRILMARREASGQRAADLARFRELKKSEVGTLKAEG
jgi:predicted membrane metal-binding protein